MAALFQFPYVLGIPVLPVRRVIAIDPGSHSVKLVLAESAGGRVRLLHQKLVDLPGEGLVSPEEIGLFIQNTLRDLGDYPVALALPQHLPLSQLIDLGPGSTDGVRQLIEQETLKNRDMHDSPIVYDCLKLEPFGKHDNSFWVTLCKEKDVFAQINRLSLVTEDVCEVASSANVLAAAYRWVAPEVEQAVLVDFGASSTLVVVVVNGQPVHAATFAIGGNLLTESIAAQKKCSLEAAENLKRAKNFLNGPDALPPLLTLLQNWRSEIERIVNDWRRDNPELTLELPIVLGGGNARQPGLVDFLNQDSKQHFTFWPSRKGADLSPQMAIALGTALQGLSSEKTGSLMPQELRSHWSRQRIHQQILSIAFLLLGLAAILLVAGATQKMTQTAKKQDLLELAREALRKTAMTASLEEKAAVTYEKLRPILKRQEQTHDTLTALSLINQTKADRNLWYVLVADHLSYLNSHTTTLTNFPFAPGSLTNSIKRGFVAELCINAEGEARRRTLGQVVAELKQNPLFENVDTLPADRRKMLAEPKVLLPEKHFALALELARDEFQQPIRPPEVSTRTQNPTSPNETQRISSTNRMVVPMTNEYQ